MGGKKQPEVNIDVGCDEKNQRLLSKAIVAVFNIEYSALLFWKVVYIVYVPFVRVYCIYAGIPDQLYLLTNINMPFKDPSHHPIVWSSGRIQRLGCIHIGRMNPCVAWHEMKVLVTYPVALLVDKNSPCGDRVDIP